MLNIGADMSTAKCFKKKEKKESLNQSDTVLEVTTDHLASSAIWRTKEKVPRVAEFYRHKSVAVNRQHYLNASVTGLERRCACPV